MRENGGQGGEEATADTYRYRRVEVEWRDDGWDRDER